MSVALGGDTCVVFVAAHARGPAPLLFRACSVNVWTLRCPATCISPPCLFEASFLGCWPPLAAAAATTVTTLPTARGCAAALIEGATLMVSGVLGDRCDLTRSRPAAILKRSGCERRSASSTTRDHSPPVTCAPDLAHPPSQHTPPPVGSVRCVCPCKHVTTACVCAQRHTTGRGGFALELKSR